MPCTMTITAGAWTPPAPSLPLGGKPPAIAPAIPYDDAYDAYAGDDTPAWEVDAATPGYRPPCGSALTALVTGNWQRFFDGLTRDWRGARIFPEFECASDAPF